MTIIVASVSQGQAVADAVRSIGVAGVPCYR
jgi:hypothetical protein